MRTWLHTLRPHRAALALVVVAVAVLVASGVVVPRVLDAVADRRLAAALGGDDPGGAAAMTLSASLDDFALGADTVTDLTDTLARYPDTVDAPLGMALGGPRWIVTFPDLTALESDGSPLRLRLGSAAPTQDTWRVVAGTAPQPWVSGTPVQIALESGVADRLRATVGTTYEGSDGPLVVTAIIDADSGGPSAQAVFHRAVSDRVAVDRDVVTAGAYVAPGSIATLGPLLARAEFTATFPVRGDGLSAADIDALSRAANKASAQGATLNSGYPITVSTRLPALLAGLIAEQNALVALTALLVSAPLGAAALVAALAVVAAERRRVRERLLRAARGSPLARVATRAGVEAMLAAAVGGIVGWGAALALTPDAAPAGFAIVAVAVLVAGAVAAGVAGDAVTSWSPPPIVRIAAEILLVGAAVGAAALLITRGVPDTGVDPLVSVTPLLVVVSASAVLARVLTLVLPAVARVLARAPRLGPSLALSRLARGRGRALQITGIVIAVATSTLAVGLAQISGDGIAAASERAVGADIRACGDASAAAALDAAPAGVAVSAAVRELEGIPVAENGRVRAVTVLSAPTAALHELDAAIPRLDGGPSPALVISRSAAEVLGDAITIAGVPASVVAVVDDDTLPTDAEAWALLDSSAATTLISPSDEVCVLLSGEGGIAAVADGIRAAQPDLEVTDTATDTARRLATPTVATILGVLGGAVAIALAAAIGIATITAVAAAAERRRTRAVLTMLGARRVRGLLAAEIVPLAVVAAVLGWVTGWAGILVIAGAGGLADRLGVAAEASPAAVLTTAGATAVVVTLLGVTAILAGTATMRGRSARRDEREEQEA